MVGDVVRLQRQAEIHHDGGVDFNGLSVEERGGITPLADGFAGGASEIGIDLAVHDPEGKRLTILAYDRMEDADAAGAGRPGGFGIDGLNFRKEMGSYNVPPDANTRRFAAGTGTQRLRGSVGDDLDFFHDCAGLQRNALKEIPAGFESDLRKAKRFKAALHNF